MRISDDDVAMLTAMGFGASQAREALTVCGGHLEQAANFLLGGGGPSTTTSTTAMGGPQSTPPAPSPLTVGAMIRCGRSQYSLADGRSACTCIALTAAARFLETPTLSPSILEAILDDGVAAYRQLQAQGASSSVEHLSAEEVLEAGANRPPFSLLHLLPGGVRQGLLSSEANHPMGPKALLEALVQEQPSENWMAVLVTKTPETILLLLPPPSNTNTHNQEYWLMDSHPRPQLVPPTDSAYALAHPSLTSLLESLQTIFPPTDLGPEIPDLMAMMYNSLDLYPLLLATPPPPSGLTS